MTASCTLIIPAHNEAAVISESIAAVRRALKDSGRKWEIIVVDDGSADGTADLAERALGDTGWVLKTPDCRGKATAIAKGVRSCRTDWLIFSDADLSVSPDFFEPAVRRLDEAHVVIASRHLPGAKFLRRQPWLRQTCGEIFRRMVQAAFLPDITDFTCGLKAFRSAEAQKLFENLHCLDWTFDVEILLRAKQSGLRINQLPVSWSNRPDSRVRLLSAIFGSLLSLWRLKCIYLGACHK
ncbi:glycosyltransferase [bacterium]|nr:glycosyltransferase [bacterium]